MFKILEEISRFRSCQDDINEKYKFMGTSEYKDSLGSISQSDSSNCFEGYINMSLGNTNNIYDDLRKERTESFKRKIEHDRHEDLMKRLDKLIELLGNNDK